MHLLSLFASFLLSSFLVAEAEKIEILHFNDISGQLQSIRPNYNPDSDAWPEACETSLTGCLGGITDMMALINETPSSGYQRYVVSTGNLVGGENGWLSAVGWKDYGTLVGKYYSKPQGAQYFHTYGMKEFEAGLNRTLTYQKEHNQTRVLLANVDCNKPEYLDNENRFCGIIESRVLPIGSGSNVGLVGFINPNVQYLSSPGRLTFSDPVQGILRAIQSSGVKSVIAIGDGTYAMAQEILKIPQVKIVIYGRSFGPTKDMSSGYPEQDQNGYIATAGRYGTSVGQLLLDVDGNGNIRVEPASQLKQVRITERRDPIIEVSQFHQKALTFSNSLKGKTVFELEGGGKCWRDECNLGNLVADAMVHCAYNNVNDISTLTKPIVAIWHGGALFRDTVAKGSSISHLDIFRWLPYHNRAHLVQIRGSDLWKLFELSATGVKAPTNGQRDWGQFLQVSNGLEVFYTTSGDDVSLAHIRVLDESENKPRMLDIDRNAVYNLVIPTFIKEGRNIYQEAKGFWTGTDTDIGFDDDCVAEYTKSLGIVSVGFEERIWFDKEEGWSSTTVKKGNTVLTVFLTILFMIIFLAVVFIAYRFVYPKLMGRAPTTRFQNYDQEY